METFNNFLDNVLICGDLNLPKISWDPSQQLSGANELSSFHRNSERSLSNPTQVDIIYLDVSKAFDKVNHEKLVKKLQHYGFGGSLLAWFKSYLRNGSHLRHFRLHQETHKAQY